MTDFKLVRPCAKCPFRTDVPGYLHRGRAIEISQSLAQGAVFQCHQTTDLDNQDDDGEYRETGGEQFCAGALIMLEKMEQPNQIMRIAERTEQYDPARLDMDAPVVSSTIEFANHHGADFDEVEPECCHVCGPGCVAPAGYMMGGTVVAADFDPEDVVSCDMCGEPTCYECMDGESLKCLDCQEYEES